MEQRLSDNWITTNHIDFEYKKYILLAYLQHVNDCFEETKLYPALSELVKHYRNLVALRDQKNSLYNSFPEKLNSADLQNFKLVYEKLSTDDRLMVELESIINFSIPQFEQHLAEGKKIYDFIESKLNIYPIGIVPLHTDAGYLLLKNGDKNETVVFEYQITIFDQPTERYRAIGVQYVNSFEKTLRNTYENIKSDLLRYNKNLPNPATYVIESELTLPFEDTLLPLAKRTLVKYLH
ncbi:MAG: hypothetical protein KA347_03385 [Bacteroidia bacterium]|jgi:hypothetical protein|nr:hypothetical protein [Bacteroidia bacterium]MBP7245590.1 hypothetical protein [Bacteroidia bacterium]